MLFDAKCGCNCTQEYKNIIRLHGKMIKQGTKKLSESYITSPFKYDRIGYHRIQLYLYFCQLIVR